MANGRKFVAILIVSHIEVSRTISLVFKQHEKYIYL